MITSAVVMQALTSGLLMGFVYTLVAMGFSMVFGTMKVANFAHGQFTMLAMYVAYLLFSYFGLDPFMSLVVIIPLFFILGYLLYRVLIRFIVTQTPWTQIIVTLGLALLSQNVALLLFGGDLRGVTTSYTSATLPIGSVMLSVSRLAAGGVAVLCTVGLYLFLRFTFVGKAIRAVAAERDGAFLVGVHSDKVFGLAFALATMLEGVAGAVTVPFSMASPFTGVDFLLKAFIIVVIAGLGSVNGAIYSGLMIGVLESLASLFVTGSFAHALTFAILILVLIFKPNGLFHVEGKRIWVRRKAQDV